MSGRLTLVTLALGLLAASGCCNVSTSGIDPTGEHVFAAPPPIACSDRSNERYFDQPLGQVPCDDVSVDLEPRGEVVAPVGSEVVLVAGVCGGDGYLRTNRRLEWSIDPSSVGQFVAVEEGTWTDLLLGDFNQPRKITNVFAIGSTGRSNIRLNRGTCRSEEAVYVLRGQGWISLTSAVEGTSRVTVFAPEVYSWDARLKSAVVHWIDAQWCLPPPAINPAGTKHVLTTAVMRQSNQSPCERWHVRYQIVGGPPAVFLPTGTPAVEVPTDAAGQASVELVQREPRHGTNSIAIQIIRPGDLPGANGQRLIVGSGATLKTWTAPDLAVKTIGPATACPGTSVTYQIQVSNPGDLAAKDVVATDAVPEGLTLMTSSPVAEVAGRQLRWRLGELGARQMRPICATFRAEKPGTIVNCCEVVAAGGLRASDCATTTVALSSLELRITGPSQAAVGSNVRFEIAVTNRTAAPATGLLITDRLDPGLENPAVNQRNAIERAARRSGPRGFATRPCDLGSDAAGPLVPHHRGDRQGRCSRPPRGLSDGRGPGCRAGAGHARGSRRTERAEYAGWPERSERWPARRCRRNAETATQPDPAFVRREEDRAETAGGGRNGRFQHRTGQHRHDDHAKHQGPRPL